MSERLLITSNTFSDMTFFFMRYESGDFSFKRVEVPEANFALDDINCKGHEESLSQCIYSTMHNCGTYEAVAIDCENARSKQFSLSISRIFIFSLNIIFLQHHNYPYRAQSP